ncbi:hypothetical protein HU200_024631 [Digitaria exilis]|uniref:Uncharacterized protein n=1 Tax=Digitaria exilis TaxID=1010633 RepID=A0A835EW69_9POAL|nr:hypothetical protein HU200_024631 [Digitaria exilis]
MNVSSLVTTYMSLEEESFPSFDAKYSIVGALSNVTKLKLVSPVDNYGDYPSLLNKVLKWDLRRCPTFNNLKKLSVGDWCVDGGLHGLIQLLVCSPILEKLRLHLGLIGASASHNNTDESEARKVNCKHLKKVKITCVQGDTRVPDIVRLYLPMTNVCRKLLSSHTSVGIRSVVYLIYLVSLYRTKYLCMLPGSFTSTHFNFLQADHADIEDLGLLTVN